MMPSPTPARPQAQQPAPQRRVPRANWLPTVPLSALDRLVSNLLMAETVKLSRKLGTASSTPGDEDPPGEARQRRVSPAYWLLTAPLRLIETFPLMKLPPAETVSQSRKLGTASAITAALGHFGEVQKAGLCWIPGEATVPLLIIEMTLIMKLPPMTVLLSRKLWRAPTIMVAVGYPGAVQNGLFANRPALDLQQAQLPVFQRRVPRVNWLPTVPLPALDLLVSMLAAETVKLSRKLGTASSTVVQRPTLPLVRSDESSSVRDPACTGGGRGAGDSGALQQVDDAGRAHRALRGPRFPAPRSQTCAFGLYGCSRLYNISRLQALGSVL
jgi:hypothetical protein